MLGLGLGEILLIALVLLVVVGPDRLPKFMRTAGRIYGQMRRTADEMRRSLVLEADRQDAEDRYRRLQARRREAEEARKALAASVEGEPEDRMLPLPARDGAQADEGMAEAASPGAPEVPPVGVSDDEWSALPPHIKSMLRDRGEVDS